MNDTKTDQTHNNNSKQLHVFITLKMKKKISKWSEKRTTTHATSTKTKTDQEVQYIMPTLILLFYMLFIAKNKRKYLIGFIVYI